MSEQRGPGLGSTPSRYLRPPGTVAVAADAVADSLVAMASLRATARVSFVDAAAPEREAFHAVLRLLDPIMARLGAALQDLGEEDTKPGSWTEERLLAALNHLVTVYGIKPPAQAIPKGGLAGWQERRAKELLALPADPPVTLAQVARALSLSPSHFARAFRQSTGVSPCRWLVAQRIEAAKALLLTGPIAIIEVAQRTGYAEQSSFTKAFRRHTGLPPSVWTRNNKL